MAVWGRIRGRTFSRVRACSTGASGPRFVGSCGPARHITCLPPPVGLPHHLDGRTAAAVDRAREHASRRVAHPCVPTHDEPGSRRPGRDDEADLNVRVELPGGQPVSEAFPAQSISWSPHSIILTIPTPVRHHGAITVTLTTKATNGCHGVIVGAPASALRSAVYSVVENGVRRDVPGAQMVLSTVTWK